MDESEAVEGVGDRAGLCAFAPFMLQRYEPANATANTSAQNSADHGAKAQQPLRPERLRRSDSVSFREVSRTTVSHAQLIFCQVLGVASSNFTQYRRSPIGSILRAFPHIPLRDGDSNGRLRFRSESQCNARLHSTVSEVVKVRVCDSDPLPFFVFR